MGRIDFCPVFCNGGNKERIRNGKGKENSIFLSELRA